jgi:hypothetical protein
LAADEQRCLVVTGGCGLGKALCCPIGAIWWTMICRYSYLSSIG